jgi:predicted transcriptional regulator
MHIDVLEALVSHGPMRVTKITYKSRMSHVLLKPILAELVKKGLVQIDPSGAGFLVYVATPKARVHLDQFSELMEMLPADARLFSGEKTFSAWRGTG